MLKDTHKDCHTCPLWDHDRPPAVRAMLRQVGRPLVQGSFAGLDDHPTVLLASPAGTTLQEVLSYTASSHTALLHVTCGGERGAQG